MKIMKKIVALMAVALLLCSMLPMAVFAADGDETITVTGTSGVLDGTTSISWDGTNYQVVNYKDNSSTAIRTSDSAHFRIYVGNEFYVLGKDGALMSQVVINCVSSYLINNSANTVSDGWTVSANGTAITYTATSGSASELHISIGKQSRVTSVVITPAVASGADCDHASLVCGETCPECGEYTKEHKYSNNCVAECENGCGTANPNYADHVYDGIYDANCNVCGAAREVNFPTADSVLTITEANELGLAMSHDSTTPGKYYVTGVVESIANTTYGNLYIQDDAGNKLYVYGTYDADGTNRFDAMAEKPVVGMTITVYGVIGNYSAAAQMKNGWITEMIGGCEHEYEFECSKVCSLCGLEIRPEAECESDADYLCENGACNFCGNDVDALEHAFDDEWDADCNYGCGYTREVEEKPDMTVDTLDFTTLDQRTEYSTTVQVWQNNGLVLTNNKGGSSSNVGDYSNPARFYKGSEIIIAYPGMTSLVIDATGIGSSYLWEATLDAAGLTYTVSEQVYTITFAAPVDSITLTASNQARAYSMTATATKVGDDDCEHDWVDATCTAPKTCSICGAIEGAALGHSYVETVVDATCTAIGTKTYACSVCGDSYSEEIPMIPHTYVDGICSACGSELPLEATITFDTDKTQRIEYSTESQKWEHDGLVLINNKGESTANVGDYGAPIRLYKGSEIVISFPGMTSLIIDGPSSADYAWTATLDAAGLTYTAEGGVYTITFAEPTDSITLTAANQVRANSITASRVVACEHEYDNACDVDCNLCYETREVEHTVEHVAAKDATCAANGNIEYWYCTVCGMAWLNAECTQNTNLRAVVTPATGEHVYFDDCSAICEVCGYEREVSHNVIHVEAKAATCAANGNIEYWYCDVCGMAWLNAECTQNTNLRAVITPATGEHTYDDEYDADCNVCGDIREVPEKPVEIVYGDADGDGEITSLDVLVLQQYFAGYDATLDVTAADADGDGEVTSLDVLVLQQYFAGYDVTLGPEQGPQFNDTELDW